MKRFYQALLLALSLFLPAALSAQETDGVQSFQQERNSWRRQDKENSKHNVTQKMLDTIQSHSLRNITDAEQAFCYTVRGAAPNYSGYTIDGMEVTGFCGILTRPEIDLFIEEFLTKDENVSNVVEQCIIQPRIMLRFVRGVDYSDVLFSSPCYSFSVFNAGRIKTFNSSPASQIMDTIIDAYEKKKMAFVSPALLEQVLPIGVPQNDSQKALIKEKSQQGPIRNWAVDEEKTETAPQPEKKGWNRLKFN